MNRTNKHLCCGLVVVMGAMILTSCAANRQTVNPAVPKWAMKTPSGVDSLFAVGVATEHGSVPIVRKNAANSARVELAQVIETKVRALFDGFMRENADLLDPEAPASSDEFTRTVTRLATDATLIGSQVIEYYWDKSGKLYYALAMVPRHSLATEIKRQTEELVRQRKTAFAEEKLNEALKRMDEALKNWDVAK